MLIEDLITADSSLRVDTVELESERVIVNLTATTEGGSCPGCGVTSRRGHSYYHRNPVDLPVIGYDIRLRIRVRRFFCDCPHCPKRTFAEQFPELLPYRARRTARMTALVEQIAFEVSAESGARILAWFGVPLSPDTLLRIVRNVPDAEDETPRVLGVDDWAKKKGQSYGTILVDMERHRIIDLLDDSSSSTFAQWLQEHPGVEIICRDRGLEYIKGASVGAPQAIQVADRWHLMVNLRDAVERLLQEKPLCLRAAGEQAENDKSAAVTSPTVPVIIEVDNPIEDVDHVFAPQILTKAEELREIRRQRKQERFELVRTMHQEGTSAREIGRQLQMSTNTVHKYLDAESCPFYPEGIKRGPSKLDPYLNYLTARWEEGCHNGTQLWREIRDRDFSGCRPLVSRWATAQRRQTPHQICCDETVHRRPSSVHKTVPWSARRTAWLLVKPENDMDEDESQALQRVKEADPLVDRAHEFAQAFQEMIRQRRPEKLAQWLLDAVGTGIAPLISFANGIQKDLDAVYNALSMPWSSGQTEGHVNRLKFVKRQMYGRANFDLLRKRVLGHPANFSP